MGTFANSEDPDEMPHSATFHLGLQCFRENFLFFEIILQGSNRNSKTQFHDLSMIFP